MKIPLVPQLRWLKKFVSHPAAPRPQMEDLLEKAGDPAQREHRWKDGASISGARNAHYTNTGEELSDGLTATYNFLEGDVRLEGAFRQVPGLDRFREPIMSHDITEVDGLTLGEWLDVGKRSGKGLKIDIKQSAAIPKIISEVKQRDLPQERLIFNADIAFGPGVEHDLKFRVFDLVTDFRSDRSEMKELREAFPRATLALGLYTRKQPKGTTYTEEQLAEVIDFARDVGGPVTFPLRAEFVTPEVVETLKPHGTVSIWNDPKTFLPEDKEEAARRFRDMGVDGMIDLRGAQDDYKDPGWSSPYRQEQFIS